MPIQFNVTPSNNIVFESPNVVISAVDTTPAVSSVSAWNWFFGGTLVSTASTWEYTFFTPTVEPISLVLAVSSLYGTANSSPVDISVGDAYPLVLSFQVDPGLSIVREPNSSSVTITAFDTSPEISGVSGWNWTFNGASVATTSSWEYTFFTPTVGDIQLSVTGSGFIGTSAIAAQSINIYDADVNACNKEPVLPNGRQGSTTLNHAITSYELLAERIKMQLGFPAVRIELCNDQLYDFVDQAIEWYSKYAGFTEEYLMFNASRVYECGRGVKLDKLFTQYWEYQCNCNINQTDKDAITGQFFDCDLNNYRKVVDVFSIDPVEFTGTDTLFTLDYLFAQQTYFSYMLGSFGFDLVTWHILKDWLNLREKLFATRPYMRFDPRTQYLKLTPEPTEGRAFLGVVGCNVERPISDLVQERWVQRYALALTMIALAHIRGKFGQVTLFGGGSLNATDLMTQGLEMKKELEDEIMNKLGEVEPPMFFIY